MTTGTLPRYPAPERDRFGLVAIALVGLGIGAWWISRAVDQPQAWRAAVAAAIAVAVAAVTVPAVLELRRGLRSRIS
jgi:uncharacterized membrane protein YbhN (UPF0104 family)